MNCFSISRTAWSSRMPLSIISTTSLWILLVKAPPLGVRGRPQHWRGEVGFYHSLLFAIVRPFPSTRVP
jgi:hypothetical protein